jgi:O-antigen ligase
VSQPGMMNLGATSAVTPLDVTGGMRWRALAVTAVIAVSVLGAFASAVTVSGALVADDAGATPKLYHASLVLAGAILAARGRIVRPRAELLLYFAITIAATLLAYLVLEPRVAGIKLLIALGVALIGTQLGRVTDVRAVLRACRIASVAFLVIVTVKNAQHLPAFIVYLANPLGHPDVPALSGGGLNLEATWLALSSTFLIGTALFVPFALTAAATSALYASRAGLVVVALAGCAALAHAWSRWRATRAALATGTAAPRRGRQGVLTLVMTIATAFALGAAVLTVRQYGDPTYVAQRFATIGDEPGSMGRLTLWRGGIRVFAEYPLGVGVGNAVPVLRRVLGVDVPEDNLHNIYLQHAVETGLPGLLALLVFAVMVARRLVASRFRDHLLIFVAGYLIAGVIQFTGVDAIVWLIYGLQAGVSRGGASV